MFAVETVSYGAKSKFDPLNYSLDTTLHWALLKQNLQFSNFWYHLSQYSFWDVVFWIGEDIEIVFLYAFFLVFVFI